MGKVVSLEELILQRQQWKGNGQRLVFVSGCFDLLHPGHIRLLEQARDCGEVLAVGVLSDASVSADLSATKAADGAAKKPNEAKQIKHPTPNRPITPASERCEILAALAMVDYAFEFSDSAALPDLITRLAPNLIVEGAEPSSPASVVGETAVRAGVEVVRIPLEPGHSTSGLIERITQLNA